MRAEVDGGQNTRPPQTSQGVKSFRVDGVREANLNARTQYTYTQVRKEQLN